MHIIIDGYNLIRQTDFLRRHEKYSLETGRSKLISTLAQYKKRRGHKITIVFDGWESGSAEEERDRQANINIIYSRRGEKADEVIKRLADKSSDETVVVSSDREIASYVSRRGKTAISSLEFAELIRKSAEDQSTGEFAAGDEDSETDNRHQKKGPSKRLPKALRQKQTKIRKL